MRRIATVLGLAVAACAPEAPTVGRPALQVGEVLGGDADGFERVLGPRPFVFPADHGPHPGYRNEWWYLTANLATASGRRFGVQFTLFRTGLRPAEERASAWAPDDLYMAHVAIGDPDGGRFLPRERFARGALGLAGARAEPFAVWLEDWSLRAVDDGPATGPAGLPPLRLRVDDPRGEAPPLSLNLVLEPGEAPIANGDRGFSRKGDQAGSASYYYSLSRVPTTGVVTIDGTGYPVRGDAWLDREWSSAPLEPGLLGWDWFSLQMDDDSELMLYVLRREDGSPVVASGGTWIPPRGDPVHLSIDEVELRATTFWDSPRGGRYPAGWRLSVPSLALQLGIRPMMADQEMTLAFRYWEGAVDVEGARAGKQLRGVGFVELTGYDRPDP